MSRSTLIATAEGPDVTPGTVPAWAVVFFEEETGRTLTTLGSETYTGSVSATLPADLTGGAYEIVFEGLTDADYQDIHVAPGKHLAASLHLWWQDSPSGVAGDLARFTGLDHPLGAITPDPPPLSLVAVLRVDRLWRRSGTRRFEAVVSGRELVTAQLSGTDADPVPQPGLQDAVRAITDKAGVELVRYYGLADVPPPPGAGAPVQIPVREGTCLQALTGVLEDQARKLLRRYGQPLALIRNGVLHVGVWAGDAGPQLPAERRVDDDSGLLVIERGSARPREQAAGNRPDAPQSRLTVSVTTLGRPDLKPGDTLVVELPPEDFPKVEPPSIGATLLGSLNVRPFGDPGPGATPVHCRITEVSHRVSREEGFLTVAKAFVLADGDDGWDLGGTPAPEVRAAPQVGEAAADPAQAFAVSLRGATASLTSGVAQRARSHVGLVHDHVAAEATETRHTSDFWVSRDPGDGTGSTAQRVVISRDAPAEAHRVPYATPFAWGNFGLVLPRYPGTRALLVDGAGGPGEYVDAGALWVLGAGPAAQAGDYWLALPANVEAPEHLPHDGSPPSEVDQVPLDGAAAHDLTDRRGNRVVETARFVLRVVDDPGGLTPVPQRPDPEAGAPAGSVLIETKPESGTPARILLRADGSVTITGSSITFDAGDGQIDFRAKDVRVALAGGTMDVS
ncbi:hypothetical protein [Amycolatopsis vancoresmycina]|uniref:hypothetical protein n=1 Tax=Amycolatopsis vancoresmycina TaxID=208444 RepID=UPI000524CB5A|nr:hypothetical protein [Amycolatopsis vancoresmycina]